MGNLFHAIYLFQAGLNLWHRKACYDTGNEKADRICLDWSQVTPEYLVFAHLRVVFGSTCPGFNTGGFAFLLSFISFQGGSAIYASK